MGDKWKKNWHIKKKKKEREGLNLIEDKESIKEFVIFMLPVGITVLSVLSFLSRLSGREVIISLLWLIYIILSGFLFLPLIRMLLPTFKDRGYAFSFAFGGMLLPAFLMFVSGVLFNTPFTRLPCVIFAISLGAVSVYFAARRRSDTLLFTEQEKRQICAEISLIVFIYCMFLWLISKNSAAYGLEKFMDYGFLNKMITSEKLPPDDVWLAGKNINYYYGGQYFCAFLSKMLNTPAKYSYNICRALIPAIFTAEAFSLSFQLIFDKQGRAKYAIPFGALSAAMASFGGNGHYFFYKILKIGGKKYSYWFPDATRFIGHYPKETADAAIHEFPCYSFIVGDLHAHMINLMLVLVLLAILYTGLVRRERKYYTAAASGFLVGVFSMTNYWDYIIYLTVSVITYIACALLSDDRRKRRVRALVLQIVITVSAAYITAIPFKMSFYSIFKGVKLCVYHSKIWQLLVLWGILVLPSVLFIIFFCTRLIKTKRFKAFRENEVFTFILSCCGIGLIVIPELVYVVDIYDSGRSRANTMFKLTYEAFVLLCIAFGYITERLLSHKKTGFKAAGAALTVLGLCGLGYFYEAAHSWFASYAHSIDATVYLNQDSEDKFEDDKKAINWLVKNIKGKDSVILEAPGDSYTNYERVSVLTGHSTVVGWHVHEWLWRDDAKDVAKRIEEADSIYTDKDPETVKELIKKYKVKYIFIGICEKERYEEEEINTELLESLGKKVYDDGKAEIIEMD